jgi:hypothetical protein
VFLVFLYSLSLKGVLDVGNFGRTVGDLIGKDAEKDLE